MTHGLRATTHLVLRELPHGAQSIVLDPPECAGLTSFAIIIEAGRHCIVSTIYQGIRLSTIAIVVAAALASASASAVVSIEVSSTFDADADGWKFVDVPGVGNYVLIVSGPSDVAYSATGGSPGGFISAKDPSNNTFFFTAPGKFLADQSAMYGGLLKYDLKLDPATPQWTGDPDVVLISDSGVLVYDIGNEPGTSFSTRVVPWSEAGWRVGSLSGAQVSAGQFQNVIGNLGALMIAGEFVASTPGLDATFETASLDNVVLTPVPEPSMVMLMSLGVLGIMGAACRRKRPAAN